jgi:hypothetical protein
MDALVWLIVILAVLIGISLLWLMWVTQQLNRDLNPPVTREWPRPRGRG